MNKIQILKALNAMGIYTKTCQQRNVLNVADKIKKQKTVKDTYRVCLFEKEHFFSLSALSALTFALI